jgi:glucosamine--fructose-6-phosphate aminotransferase (isomerizing)
VYLGGIFAVICKDTRIPRGAIYEGLRRLTYRGYDGAGVAFLRGDLLEVRKAPGHIENVSKNLDFVNIDSDIALGHTRYASRGWPVYENTHPLTECTRRVAVTGDGIIENYEEIKSRLEKLGHVFSSRTDTEVAVHLLEEYLKSTSSRVEALLRVIRELRGMYSLVFLDSSTRSLLVVQSGQPLVIGFSPDKSCIYVSSDLPSLYGFAETAYILEEGTVGVISRDSIDLYSSISGGRVELEQLQAKRVKYVTEYVEKGGFPHYMIKEIYEIPEALKKVPLAIMEKYLRLAAMIIQGAKKVFVIGTGTSLHAAMISTYYFSELAGLSVNVISAAEFPYSLLESVETGTVVVAVSQSGETTDVITSVKQAKLRGAVVVGITNNVGSRLALESNVYLPIGAGPEIAVPATKTFIATLAGFLMLSSYVGVYTGKLTSSEYGGILNSIKDLADKLKNLIPDYDSKIEKLAQEVYEYKNMYLAGSGITYPVALEGALKLKEAALVHAEGLQLGELRHGPLALSVLGLLTVLIEPIEEQAKQLFYKVLREVENRYARIFTLEVTANTKHAAIILPQVERHLYPMVAIIPLQLLAYHTGVVKGLPVDTPPGLAKTITT